MKKKKIDSTAVKIGGGLLAAMAVPGVVHACACGCGVFDVATSSMIPKGQGGMAWIQDAFMDQNRNWSGTSEAPAADNDDKELETDFLTFGAQYMVNDSWGAQIEIPYDFRYFKGTDENNNITSHNWSQLGDIRIEGIYTGFFADLSAGVTFGLKLPTGSYTEDPDLVDRDTQIGTGSTDVLLGGFFRHNLSADQKWDGFAQLELDVPALTQAGYRPGVELDTAAGIDYKGFTLGRALIAPVAQAIFSERTHDSGSNASPDDTGYQRLMLSPGIEVHVHPVVIYADAEFPVFQHFTGNQLAAPVLFKVSVSYMF
ncbi:MAG TPA: hypothetical protein VMA35_01715 [Candidatus Sulfopaludibacter sp.]|nr:hypothetical protein [Candidatus Sulfopaludibacter sp.]